MGVGGSGLLIGLWIVLIREFFFFFFFYVELKAIVMVVVVWWCRDGGYDGDGN